jgi:Dolichyl-phosphate-mannose-protein mannosyltransferase
MNDAVAFNTLIGLLTVLVTIGGGAIASIVRTQPRRAFIASPGLLVIVCLSITGFYCTYSLGTPYGSGMVWYFILSPFLYVLMVSSIFAWRQGSTTEPMTETRSQAASWNYIAPFAFALAGLIVFFLSKNYIGNDEGSYVYEMHLISRGLMPFKDFISRAPAELAAFLLFSKIFGASILSLKAFNALIVSLIGLVSYWTIGRFQKPLVALIGSLCIIAAPCFLLTKMVFGTTGLSCLLILTTCLLLALGKRHADVLAGMAMALAVFTRESNALFVLGLLPFLFWSNKKALPRVMAGGLLIAVPTMLFFGWHIGMKNAVDILLGLGHVGAEESRPSIVFSLGMLWFFFMSALPFLTLFMTGQKRAFAKQDASLFIWILLMGLFYGWYIDKRAFMLSYGSEFIPLIGVLVFSLMRTDHALYAKKYLMGASVTVAFLLLIAPYAFVGVAQGDSTISKKPFPLDRLIGSGIPSKSFEKITSVLRENTRQGDIIFAGNLAFASENGLTQFMDISRPMVYEGETGMYKLYGAPSRADVVTALSANPPRAIVSDHHMAISFLPDIQGLLNESYTTAYSDDFATVFVIKGSR